MTETTFATTHAEPGLLLEQEAITAVLNGQTLQFEVLYDLYAEKIYRYLFYRIHHKELAEDLTSQTFLQAFQRLHQYNKDKGVFAAWLYRIARNLMIDEARRKKPTDTIDNYFDLTDNSNVEEQTDQVLLSKAVKEFLQTLPQDARELITMRLWDELSYAEIAEITGKTEGALKMQFSRLIKQLQTSAPPIFLALMIIHL